jgi:hypothetical protein
VYFSRKKKKKGSNWIYQSNQDISRHTRAGKSCCNSSNEEERKQSILLATRDTETKETLKKAKIRLAEQLRKDTLAQYSRRRRLRSSINNRIQQQQYRRKNE